MAKVISNTFFKDIAECVKSGHLNPASFDRIGDVDVSYFVFTPLDNHLEPDSLLLNQR